MVGQPLPDRANTFYVYDVAEGGGGRLSSYAPQVEGMYQFELITVRGKAGSLEYFFSGDSQDHPRYSKSFVYSEKTGAVSELERYIPRMNDPGLFASTSHYIDFIPNPFDATHMQVSEIKVK